MSRVLITEMIAQAGIDRLKAAGHQVEVRCGLAESELVEAVDGAHGLIIRSATNVTDEVLAAGNSLVVVGRAGIGLDNVDVVSATKRGVLVVNAPRSNVLSAAEHTMALILAQARNVPQASEALRAGRWERSAWTGVELHGKTLGVIGLGRIGGLVAERARAFGMQLVGYDPYVSDEWARERGVELVSLDELASRSDIVTIHVARTPETVGLVGNDFLAKAKDGIRIVNVARGGIVDEQALFEAITQAKVAGAALDVFDSEPCVESPLFELPNVVATPHLGASTHEAQYKAGMTIAEQVTLALAGDFAPFAVNIDAVDVADVMRPYVSLAEQVGAMVGAFGPDTLGAKAEIALEGEIGRFDNRLILLAASKGLAASLGDEPASYVNAMTLLADLGIEVSATSVVAPRDYVNRLEIRGSGCSVAATLVGLRDEARIVDIDGHSVDIPLSENMLVVRNDDRPGMIGSVGTLIGANRINIRSMDVGRDKVVGSAMMVMAIDRQAPDELVDQLRQCDGVLSVTVLDTSTSAQA